MKNQIEKKKDVKISFFNDLNLLFSTMQSFPLSVILRCAESSIRGDHSILSFGSDRAVVLQIMRTTRQQNRRKIHQFSSSQIKLIIYQQQYKKMVKCITMLILLLALYVFYRYYYRPKQEIKRYKSIFQQLGYKVFEQEFAFFGLSNVNYWNKGTQLHKDAFYYERTIYPFIDISIGNIMDKVLIYLVHPDLAKEFLIGNIIFKYPKYEILISSFKAAIGEGIVFSQGEVWKGKRKIMSKLFSFDLITKNIPQICALCDKYFDQFDEKSKVGENSYKYCVTNLGTQLFNGVIMNCFFGANQVKEKVKGMTYEAFFVEAISQATVLAMTPLMVLMGKLAWKIGLTKRIREVKENVEIMRKMAHQIIQARTKEVLNSPRSERCTDIIEALVYEALDNNKSQLSYSKQELVDQFQTFLLAGTNTTTQYFTMIVYYLGKYPQVHKKVRDQVNSLIKSDEDINHQNLKKMCYVDYFQREVTRHYGPATRLLERIAIEDNYIKDLPIKKGTLVSFQHRGTHYSETYYKDPMQFRPERWESQCDYVHPYAFTGFSAGTRTCLGKHLALLESKVAIVKLIKRYEAIEVPSEITKIKRFNYEVMPFDTKFTKLPAEK